MRAAVIERHDPAGLCLEQHYRLTQQRARQRPLTELLRLGRDVPGVRYVHDEVLSLQVEAHVNPEPAGRPGDYRGGAGGIGEVVTDGVVTPVGDIVGEYSRLPAPVIAVPGQPQVGQDI